MLVVKRCGRIRRNIVPIAAAIIAHAVQDLLACAAALVNLKDIRKKFCEKNLSKFNCQVIEIVVQC